MADSGCINAMVPGRIKFDPEFYPEAPWVPIEAGPLYLQLVQQRCPTASGELIASLAMEERRERAWVSSDTDYGGIILEWGSCRIPPSHIMSQAAQEAMQMMGVEQPEVTAEDQAKEDEKLAIERRLEKELGAIIRPATRSFRGRDAQSAFLRALRGDVTKAFGGATTGDPTMIERLKIPFRATLTQPARRPPARLLRRLHQYLEPLREAEGLTTVLELEGLL